MCWSIGCRCLPAAPKRPSGPGLTYDEVLGTVSRALDEKTLVITDTSLSMYPAAELNLVGLAMRAERKVIDKIVDGLKFHS